VEIANVSILLAFAAGVVSILSPCVLPLIPIYLAYLTGTTAGDMTANNRSAAVLHSVAFTAGFGAVLIILGVSVGLVGYALRDNLDVISKVAGVLMILMGLHVARVFRIPYLDREYALEVSPSNHVGYVRSFGIGAAYSVGWTPCIGPTLGAVLALAATSSTVAEGGFLLAVYALGFSVPFIAAGFAIGWVGGLMRALRPHLPKIEVVSGVVMVAVGVLVFQGALIELNRYFSGFSPTISI
jgi:cytochrome c-type biogenesis protein